MKHKASGTLSDFTFFGFTSKSSSDQLNLPEEIDRDIGLAPYQEAEVIVCRPDPGADFTEEVVLLVTLEKGYRLLCACRQPDEEMRWRIKELPVELFLGDPLLATETYVTYDRLYAQRPSAAEIETFVTHSSR